MTALDLIVLAMMALSVLFAYFRGMVREVVALAAWIAGLVAGFRYMDDVATIFSGLDVTPAVRHVLAFTLILVAFMIAGALVAWLLRSVVRAVGLGFVDRFLGALFGVARGALIAVLFALIAGVTTLPQHDWWQNSLVGPVLADSALSLRAYLPREWAERLDFSATGKTRMPAAGSARIWPDGEAEPCVES
jgi:membrane protein required for colicin V production